MIPKITIGNLTIFNSLSDDTFDAYVSLLSPSSSLDLHRPNCIPKTKHYIFLFDDVTSPDKNLKAPDVEVVNNIISLGRTIFHDSVNTPKKIFLHCHAGVSRSPAVAYIWLCDWLGKGMELEAVSLTKDFSKFIHPNKLLIELADSILNREGQMKLTAYEFYKF